MGTATDKPNRWSWGQFFGWGSAAAIGAGIASAASTYLTGDPNAATILWDPIVLNGVVNGVGGAIGGAGGYGLSHVFDDMPEEKLAFKRSFLFGLVFTLLIASLLTFPNLDYLKANLSTRLHFGFVVSVLSGFLAACLKGVLNNLRCEARGEDRWMSR